MARPFDPNILNAKPPVAPAVPEKASEEVPQASAAPPAPEPKPKAKQGRKAGRTGGKAGGHGRPAAPKVERTTSVRIADSLYRLCERACDGDVMAKLPSSLRTKSITVMGYLMGTLGEFPDDIPDEIKRVGYAYQQQHSEDATIANLTTQVRELSSAVGRQSREIAALERLVAMLLLARFDVLHDQMWKRPANVPADLGYDDPYIDDVISLVRRAMQAQDHREHMRLQPNTRRG